jgi:HD-like signal output (HDOD) protein
MGIIHDIGKMLLLKAIADIFPDKSIEDSELHVAIHEIHTTFGAVLLKKMRFSKAFIQIAEFHHWNSYSKETEPELMIINLADHLAYKIGFGFLDDKTREETREEMVGHISSLSSFKQLGLDPDKVMEICDQVKAMVKESARAF